MRFPVQTPMITQCHYLWRKYTHSHDPSTQFLVVIQTQYSYLLGKGKKLQKKRDNLRIAIGNLRRMQLGHVSIMTPYH